MLNTKKCLICNKGKKNDVLYWHIDKTSGDIWCWCNKCDRGYSLYSYCQEAGISLKDFIAGEFDFYEAKPNEVQKMEWPSWFLPLHDTRCKKGAEYVESRGLTLEGDMYYDIENEGIVFPYYYENHFVGSQTRFLVPRVKEDEELQKMDTLPGTRLGLVFYGWNQQQFMGNVKGVVVTEGAFNALSLQQALNSMYGGITRNPWKCICISGSGIAQHHQETLKELKEQGLKVIAALDSDEAGLKGLSKLKDAEAITHYALTMDSTKDWNDIIQQEGRKGLAKWFLKSIKNIKDVV